MLSDVELLKIRDSVDDVAVSEDVMKYIVSFNAIRKDQRVSAGPSPRALLALMSMARAVALMRGGRDYVIPDDVKMVAVEVLSHRIFLKPEMALEGGVRGGEDIIIEYLNKIPVPK